MGNRTARTKVDASSISLDELGALAAKISTAMQADQRAFRRRLSRLRRSSMHGADSGRAQSAWARLERDVCQSVACHARRRERCPVPTFPDSLPVAQHREKIAQAIAAHPVVVVCGETGSGKTTQLPKICLELGRGAAGLIGHTQPRRIAARSIAARIAQELNVELGSAVGYKVRFTDRLGPDTYIKLMTDGILLAETQGDHLLDQYDTLIIDEAHERSLNIDFLLGYLKGVLARRLDLKLIITSATIDPGRFSRHFNNAPIIEVSGRTYPVEVRYRPLQVEDEDERDRGLQQAILDAVDEVCAIDVGDVLIFASGEREIRETAEALRKHHPPNTEVLPLYARLSTVDQSRVFRPHSTRRLIIATNIAETSLTVPGIRYVIDTGRARISRYSHRTKVQRLPIERISQASADQRKGRCGRMSAGICIRVYSQEDYEERAPFTVPEIQRTNLAGVILQMKALSLGEIEQFPFIDVPDPKMIKDGFRLLTELGALDANNGLTVVGRQLSALPVDPRIGRMILAGRDENCLGEALVIASALSVQDPRERPLDAREKADERHQQFSDERSDFLGFLKLWHAFEERSRHSSKNKLRAFCRDNLLSYVRMQNWRDTQHQLQARVKEMGFRINEQPAAYEAIHRAVLAGLLGNIGLKVDGNEYLRPRGGRLSLFPGSVLFKKGPRWIVAAELVHTTRLYARTVATIEPEWIEQLSGELCRRAFSDPHWDSKRGTVMAYEQVSLYGLVIVDRRKVGYAPINLREARAIFIQQALVEGAYKGEASFLNHNRALIAEIENLEHRSRRRGILVDAQWHYDFYDRHIPQDICDGVSFEDWLKQAQRGDPKLLFIKRDDLVQRSLEGVTRDRFPDYLAVGSGSWKLHYHFEPGHPSDGVTVTLPAAALNQVDPQPFGWLVPGLLHEKIIALLRSLPKSLRRNFVPLPDFATACLEGLTPGQGSLTNALALHLHRMTGVSIPADAWNVGALPPHLRMNFRVVGGQGREIVMGRDLAQLQRRFGKSGSQVFSEMPLAVHEKQNITCWDIGDIPEHLSLRSNGQFILAYPALVDEQKGVSLRLFDSAQGAAKAMGPGLRRLFMVEMAQQIKYLRNNIPQIQQMCLYYAPIGGCEQLKRDFVDAVVDHLFIGDDVWVRNADEFCRRKEEGRPKLMTTAVTMSDLAATALECYHMILQKLDRLSGPAWQAAVSDIRSQLDHLMYSGFIRHTPYRRLEHFPRYLKAAALRLEKLAHAPARDLSKLAEISPLWKNYLVQAEKAASAREEGTALDDYRWALEELRVSLFAQELKTAFPVSVKRLRERWQALKNSG